MQYGFLIDHDRCIGCHACTVACKAENDVPVGDFRTWVKYTEEGTFPDIKRNFAVLRCNHCTDAPCVTICPVNALEKRKDGIVDIDRDACIGCRACMQACPYDAIYLNEDKGTVEKCHFCAHRVEQGIEPACVVVCPETAIIAGDLDDPESKISLMVMNNTTQVRRPEQGTGPNVHYKGVSDIALTPGSAARPEMYLWSDRPNDKPEPWPDDLPLAPDARTVLDIGHKVEWGWPVAMYLVTKGIAGGVMMLAPFAAALGLTGFAHDYVPELFGLLFILLTNFLLVEDLARPMRFYRMLTRPNWKSWLVKGGIILTLFSVLVTVLLVLRYTGNETGFSSLRWLGLPLGVAVAGYTAFLFAQCKGRDLWESKLLLPHLIMQSLMCGSASLLPFAPGNTTLQLIFIFSTSGHGLFALSEVLRRHSTDNARQAAAFLRVIRLGPLAPYRDGLIIGVGVSLVMIVFLPAFVCIPALIGLYLYEHAFIRAGQLPPLS